MKVRNQGMLLSNAKGRVIIQDVFYVGDYGDTVFPRLLKLWRYSYNPSSLGRRPGHCWHHRGLARGGCSPCLGCTYARGGSCDKQRTLLSIYRLRSLIGAWVVSAAFDGKQQTSLMSPNLPWLAISLPVNLVPPLHNVDLLGLTT